MLLASLCWSCFCFCQELSIYRQHVLDTHWTLIASIWLLLVLMMLVIMAMMTMLNMILMMTMTMTKPVCWGRRGPARFLRRKLPTDTCQPAEGRPGRRGRWSRWSWWSRRGAEEDDHDDHHDQDRGQSKTVSMNIMIIYVLGFITITSSTWSLRSWTSECQSCNSQNDVCEHDWLKRW